jgi:Flp pilus assembly protein TadG
MSKPMQRPQRRRGTVLVEFSMAGIASICLLISTVSLGIGMWNYHTLAYAVHEGTRYVSVKGKNCTLPGNTCSVSVGTIAQKIAAVGVGLPPDKVNLTLTTASGAVTSCAPINSCYTDTTVWPPGTNSDNKAPAIITISAKYHFQSPILFFWPGKGKQDVGSIWLPASSTQQILF